MEDNLSTRHVITRHECRLICRFLPPPRQEEMQIQQRFSPRVPPRFSTSPPSSTSSCPATQSKPVQLAASLGPTALQAEDQQPRLLSPKHGSTPQPAWTEATDTAERASYQQRRLGPGRGGGGGGGGGAEARVAAWAAAGGRGRVQQCRNQGATK